MTTVHFFCVTVPKMSGVLQASEYGGGFGYKGEFVIFMEGSKTRVSFFLKDANGGESYQFEIRRRIRNGFSPILSRSPQPIVVFESIANQVYRFSCIVNIPPRAIYPPRVDVLTSLIGLCDAEPDYLLTFKCGDECVKAVTVIMAARSPVIHAMMQAECIEAKSKVIKIVDFSADVIKKMVEFCQSNNISDTKGFEVDLYRVADKYDIVQLKELSSILVIETISAQTVMDLLAFAKSYPFQELERKCLEFAVSNMVEICKSSAVDSKGLMSFWEAMKQFCLDREAK